MKAFFARLLGNIAGLLGYQLVPANVTPKSTNPNSQIDALIKQLAESNKDRVHLRQQLSDKDELIAELNERIRELEDNVVDESDDEDRDNSQDASHSSVDSDNEADDEESADNVLDKPEVVCFSGLVGTDANSAAATTPPSSPRP